MRGGEVRSILTSVTASTSGATVVYTSAWLASASASEPSCRPVANQTDRKHTEI